LYLWFGCTELQALGLGWHAVAFVHLYLADMAHFSAANAMYSALLPGTNPPGRACVQLPLPAGCPVSVSVVAMCNGVALTPAADNGDGSGGSSGSWETVSDSSCPEELPAEQGASPVATAAGDEPPEAQLAAQQQAKASAAPPATVADDDAVSPAARAAEAASVAQSGRRVLHIQSISEWAPCMIGPYSQGVAAAGLIFMSGVIPLHPPTMQLVSGAP
jgi:enamine deaminase RidA (YjgF/YER057c/UK114 family)